MIYPATMEQVLFRVHVRLIRMTQMYFNSSSRRIFEKLLLLIAILSLFLLSVLHLTYVSPVLFKSTCLTDENIIIGSKVDLLSIQILQEDYLIGTKSWNSCKSDTCLTTDRHVWNAWGLLRSSAPFQRNNTYVFSVEKGFLLLPSDTLFKHNVSRREVLISSSAACLGPPLSTFLLRHFIGFDTVAKNWVIRKFGGRGYLHNIHAEVRTLVFVE